MAGATWEEILQTGSWKGVRFDFVSVRDEHARELDRREYPGRPGQEIEDRTRKGLTISVRAVFVEEDYPDQLNAVLKAVDEGGIGELVHPVFGTMQAAVQSAIVTHDADDSLDAAMVDIIFAEHSTNAIGPFETSESLAALASATRAACDDVNTAAAKMDAFLSSGGTP
ncbi:MAG TPA: DNA circularization N-terminal domain-containing protein [Gaiellaceae bacterium]|nr:DNA circularization N-terminal domain-containing protein [Gaiellaceae bacterium]